MLEADLQGVALETMTFCSGHYKHLSEGTLFKQSYFHGSPLQEQEFFLGIKVL